MRAGPRPWLPSPAATTPPTQRQPECFSRLPSPKPWACLTNPADKNVLVLYGGPCDRKITSLRSSHSPGAHPVDGTSRPYYGDYLTMFLSSLARKILLDSYYFGAATPSPWQSGSAICPARPRILHGQPLPSSGGSQCRYGKHRTLKSSRFCRFYPDRAAEAR